MTTATTRTGYYLTSELDREAFAFYEKQGFLVITDAFSSSEVDRLLSDSVAICRGDHGEITREISTGTGEVQSNPIPKREELLGLTDDEVLAHFLCIHFPHKCSPIMADALSHSAVVKALTGVIGPNVKCMQSMLFIKSAGKPGQAWHQDEAFIPTRDRSLAGAWIAMDDAHVENGCLWVIPGSHKPGILWPQYPHDKPEFDCTLESYDFPYGEGEAVPVEVPRGAVVIFNGYLLHRSLQNVTEDGYRRALVNHYMSAESLLPWHQRPGIGNATNDIRDIVMVAGEDPYAFKGVEEVHRPYVRAAGQGGCGDGRLSLEEFRVQAEAAKKRGSTTAARSEGSMS